MTVGLLYDRILTPKLNRVGSVFVLPNFIDTEDASEVSFSLDWDYSGATVSSNQLVILGTDFNQEEIARGPMVALPDWGSVAVSPTKVLGSGASISGVAADYGSGGSGTGFAMYRDFPRYITISWAFAFSGSPSSPRAEIALHMKGG